MKILTYLVYTVFVLILVSVAGLFLVSLLPIPGNVEIKIVRSGSMEPTIPVGAVVVVQPAETYAVGDVITFGEDSKSQIPTTHRIMSSRVSGSQTLFVTKGDANEDPDEREVTGSEVIGKVLFSVPFAGYILDFARQPIGFALMIALPAAVIIIDELLKIIREVMGMRRKSRYENI